MNILTPHPRKLQSYLLNTFKKKMKMLKPRSHEQASALTNVDAEMFSKRCGAVFYVNNGDDNDINGCGQDLWKLKGSNPH